VGRVPVGDPGPGRRASDTRRAAEHDRRLPAPAPVCTKISPAGRRGETKAPASSRRWERGRARQAGRSRRVRRRARPVPDCEVARHAADRLCVLPDGLSFEQAAAMMLKGHDRLQYLIRRTPQGGRRAKQVLLPCAAGGVGLIACQWLKALGRDGDRHGRLRKRSARSRGGTAPPTASTTQREFRRARPGDHTWRRSAGRLRLGRKRHLPGIARLSEAARVDGEFSATPPGRSRRSSRAILAQKGSLYLTRPTLVTYTRSARTWRRCPELLDIVLSGKGDHYDRAALSLEDPPRRTAIRGPQDHLLEHPDP